MGARSSVEQAEKYLRPEVVGVLRQAIVEAGGNEVFFVGGVDEEGRVGTARVLARGNMDAVPALLQACQPGEVVLHNHPSGDLTPSEADVAVAAELGSHSVGTLIVDNPVARVYAVVPPLKPPRLELLDGEALAKLLQPDGPVARRLARYERRPQQERMLGAVVEAFNEDRVGMIEAGTGTGKTLAYLIPAADWAHRNDERVVVSTHTINLQEQILHKDLPVVSAALGRPVEAALILGRGNYLCLRKFAQLVEDPQLLLEEEESSPWNDLRQWGAATEWGVRTELPFIPPAGLWEKVCSEADLCPLTRCPDQGRCFVQKARRRASAADLVIANHHLLCADLALREELNQYAQYAILPAYRRLVIDEAHHLEDVAAAYFGIQVAQAGFLQLLGRLYSVKRDERGVLPLLRSQLVRDRSLDTLAAAVTAELVPAVERVRGLSRGLFQRLGAFVVEAGESEEREPTLRITQQLAESAQWHGMAREQVDDLKGVVSSLLHSWAQMRQRLRPALEDPAHRLAAAARDVDGLLQRLAVMTGNLEAIVAGEKEERVHWADVRGSGDSRRVRLFACPIDVSGPLEEAVYRPLRTVILTSATLTVAGRFAFMERRTGLDRVEEGRRITLSLPSPFDYPSQVLVAIPTDLPDPRDRAFEDSLPETVGEVLRRSGGRAFVLFTSFRALDATYQALRASLEKAGTTPLKQGMAPRHQLLERFRADVDSVLFGTDSFWEGVDVEGEALQCVILAKLPFRVPTEPLEAARAEAITRAGGNPFLEYVLPQAAIKLKQGFGRLVRRRSDWGAVVILDRRVVTQAYGRVFLDSLPTCQTAVGTTREVLDALEGFFGGQREVAP